MGNTFGILLFPEMEELDFVGPLEAFGMYAKYFNKDWQVVTIAQTHDTVPGAKGMKVVPDHSFDDCPSLDVLVVPGGQGTEREVDNAALISFVQQQAERCRYTTSVCTGAFIMERAGLLAGRKATTHWASVNRLRELGVDVVNERFVHEGNVITAAGVSAGIDMALYVVGLLSDAQTARNVQKAMEYYPEPPYAEAPAAVVGKGAS